INSIAVTTAIDLLDTASPTSLITPTALPEYARTPRQETASPAVIGELDALGARLFRLDLGGCGSPRQGPVRIRAVRVRSCQYSSLLHPGPPHIEGRHLRVSPIGHRSRG